MPQSMVPVFDRDSFAPAGGQMRSDTWIDDAGIERQRELIWLYNGTGAALVAGEPMVMRYDGDGDVNPAVAVCTESPVGVSELIVIPINATAIAAWDWFVWKGYTEAMCNGDAVDIAKDDFLKVNATTDADAFVEDTTTRTPYSAAIYSDDTAETDSTVSSRLVYLFGLPVPIEG